MKCQHDYDIEDCMACLREDRDDMREAIVEIDALRARVARWVRVTPADEKPPIGTPVRVVWSCRGKSDPKRAVWTGSYWATTRRTGHYEDSPDYWLFEPALPEPPTL